MKEEVKKCLSCGKELNVKNKEFCNIECERKWIRVIKNGRIGTEAKYENI